MWGQPGLWACSSPPVTLMNTGGCLWGGGLMICFLSAPRTLHQECVVLAGVTGGDQDLSAGWTLSSTSWPARRPVSEALCKGMENPHWQEDSSQQREQRSHRPHTRSLKSNHFIGCLQLVKNSLRSTLRAGASSICIVNFNERFPKVIIIFL